VGGDGFTCGGVQPELKDEGESFTIAVERLKEMHSRRAWGRYVSLAIHKEKDQSKGVALIRGSHGGRELRVSEERKTEER